MTRKKKEHAISHEEYLKRLPLVRRKKIAARAKDLLAEEMTLRELRKARHHSQVKLAQILGAQQGDISKFERRSDAYLSTIRRYVEAMGGQLDLIVSFPHTKPVRITRIGDI